MDVLKNNETCNIKNNTDHNFIKKDINVIKNIKNISENIKDKTELVNTTTLLKIYNEKYNNISKFYILTLLNKLLFNNIHEQITILDNSSKKIKHIFNTMNVPKKHFSYLSDRTHVLLSTRERKKSYLQKILKNDKNKNLLFLNTNIELSYFQDPINYFVLYHCLYNFLEDNNIK